MLQLSWPRQLFRVILPAAAPGHRGRAAHLLRQRLGGGRARRDALGGMGIGYFVWNEWNNLDLAGVIFAILVIGVIGVLLDARARPALAPARLAEYE